MGILPKQPHIVNTYFNFLLRFYTRYDKINPIHGEVITMPIKISDSLPARAVLESENIFVMTEYRALHQDIRPLHVLILNLMPTKIVTEIQLMRKLANSPFRWMWI